MRDNCLKCLHILNTDNDLLSESDLTDITDDLQFLILEKLSNNEMCLVINTFRSMDSAARTVY